MANKIGVIIVVVAVIGVVSAVVLSQEGGITSNAGERFFQMVNDSAPSHSFGNWDCSTYKETRSFQSANGEAISEYQGSLGIMESTNLNARVAQWHQNCG